MKSRLRHRRIDKGLEYDLRDRITIKLFMVPEPADSCEKKLLDDEHDVDEQREGPANDIDNVLCESCSRPNLKGDLFCTYCGAKIDGLSLPD
jgi:hypothetical protein